MVYQIAFPQFEKIVFLVRFCLSGTRAIASLRRHRQPTHQRNSLNFKEEIGLVVFTSGLRLWMDSGEHVTKASYQGLNWMRDNVAKIFV